MVQEALAGALLQSLQVAEEKLDSELERLDKMDEDDLENIRRKRIEQMKQAQKMKQKWAVQGHGSYETITDEKEFFKRVKGSKRVVVHFSRSTTWRCEIIDKHINKLVAKHMETKFVKVDAEKSPYLVEKLHIWMLPTLVIINDGRTDHSIVGFDEYGGNDDFTTHTFEQVLLAHGAVLEEYV